MAKLIPITQNKSTIVDDEDYVFLSQYKWRAIKSQNHYYVGKSEKRKRDKPRKLTLMHRLIMCSRDGEQVDHINGDSLDNQKHNLRLCTQGQNLFNKNKYKNNKTGFKGISVRGKKWRVQVQANKKQHIVGHFNTINEAIAAYNAVSKKIHGEFSRPIEVNT